MAVPLAIPDDVADLWRTLTIEEITRTRNLIDKASALLRQRMPAVDARILQFATDPTDPAGLNPVTVATVVASSVKRFLINVSGVVSESVGPYSVSYANRGEKDVRGELHISDTDIEKLLRPSKAGAHIGTIKSHPRLAPWPYGDIGGPSRSGSSDQWLLDQQGGRGELPYLPYYPLGS